MIAHFFDNSRNKNYHYTVKQGLILVDLLVVMTIEQFIIDLLKQHNCVVVPNFGGFIANYQPAKIDSVSKTISPPSKQVLFNANLIKNDGLLANYVADKRAISYADSLLSIAEKTKDWQTALANDKRLPFGEIGFLYEQDGAIVFEQNRDTNLWLKAYGLSSIQFVAAKDLVITNEEEIAVAKASETLKMVTPNIKKPVERPVITLADNEKIETVADEQADTKVIPLAQEKKSRKKWGYLAVACAIPFLFYTYWIPMETNFLETGNVQLSDFNPFSKSKAKKTYTQRAATAQKPLVAEEIEPSFSDKIAELSPDVEVYAYQFDEDLYIPVKLDPKPTAPVLANDKDVITDNAVSQTTNTTIDRAKEAPIQLITGCFSVESNAKSLVSELSSFGYLAYILDKNKGLYRVAVKGFDTIETAKAAKADLKAKSYSSWILRK